MLWLRPVIFSAATVAALLLTLVMLPAVRVFAPIRAAERLSGRRLRRTAR
jgi:hypothetical protein